MIKKVQRLSDLKFLLSLENDIWVDNVKDAFEMTYRECETAKTVLLNTYTLEQIKEIVHWNDGWTVTTKDKKISAHFEHDVHVTAADPDILSSFEEIEKAEQKNSNLVWSY